MDEIIFAVQALIIGIMFGAFYGLFASGLTLSFGVSRQFNFAHGEFMVLGVYICFLAYTFFNTEAYAMLPVVIVILFGLGWFVYRYLMKRVLLVHLIMVLQLTLGLVFLLSNGMMLFSKEEVLNVETFITYSTFAVGPFVIKTSLLVAFAISSLIGIGMWWVLRSTDFGRTIRAVAQDSVAAELMGIDVHRVRGLGYGIGFALAGVAGVCAIPLFVIDPFTGLHLTLLAFIVITIGGLGNFLGALIAGIIIGVVESLAACYLGGDLGIVAVYSCFILMLLIRPEGIFGEKVEVILS